MAAPKHRPAGLKDGVSPRRIVIQPADENTPGYLYRTRKFAEIKSKMDDPDTPEATKLALFDEMVDLIVPFVVEPADPIEARNLIVGPNGLSKKEVEQIFGLNQGDNAEVPLAKNRRSRRTSAAK